MDEEALIAEGQAAHTTAQWLQHHHQFELLGSVLNAFLNSYTHRGAHYSLPQLLETPHERQLLFFHHSIPYLATVTPSNCATASWVNIQLCNEGFAHEPCDGTPAACHSGAGGAEAAPSSAAECVVLPSYAYQPQLHSLQSSLLSTHSHMRAF
jgi:hypothetical protein